MEHIEYKIISPTGEYLERYLLQKGTILTAKRKAAMLKCFPNGCQIVKGRTVKV